MIFHDLGEARAYEIIINNHEIQIETRVLSRCDSEPIIISASHSPRLLNEVKRITTGLVHHDYIW